jgi:tetratricopeptide (TPR) repeat protein
MVQHNVGTAYGDLAQYQTPVEHLQSAIYCYQQALQYRSPERHPAQYVATQNNLGTAYWKLSQYDHAVVYLREAIAAYESALRYSQVDDNPLHYAMIQNNLSTAYWQLAQHEDAIVNLRQAIQGYEQASRYRTLDYPASHASTQNNLGAAHRQLAQYYPQTPVAQEHLEAAIAAYGRAIHAAALHQQQQPNLPLSFDLGSTHSGLATVLHQLAHLAAVPLEEKVQHLYQALSHCLQALELWQHQADLSQMVLGQIVQTIRTCYQECGLDAQNAALSQVPSHLLPQIISQL